MPGNVLPDRRLSGILAAIALLFAALAFGAHWRQVGMQGPSALGVLPDQSVWLLVDQSLWHLGPQGDRRLVVPMATAGLPREPAVIAPRGSNELYTLARGATEVLVLDARQGRLLRRLPLQWPADLRDHLAGGLWMAVHPDGRVAAAAGGSHAVVLFDREGRLMARTAPNTYRYTNGLWWDDDALWTTDTDGHALVRLHGQTLVEQQRLPLSDEHRQRFTVLGARHPHHGIDPNAPVATIARLAPDMTTGRVAQVWLDGMEKNETLEPDAQPRELAWQGERLLIVDGRDFRLRRFDIDRRPLPDLGDEQVRRELNERHTQWRRWHAVYVISLAGAVLSLLGAAILARRAKGTGSAAQAATMREETRFLGTPPATGLQVARQVAVVVGPLVLLPLMLPAALLLQRWIGPHGLADRLGRHLLMLIVALALLLWVAGLMWWMRRTSRQPALEPLFNRVAVQWLAQDQNFLAVREPGEHVRETAQLRGLWQGHWLVLSNRRLYLYKAGWLDRPLTRHWHREEVLSARVLPAHQVPWHGWLWGGGWVGAWLRIELTDGRVLQGQVPSAATAHRLAALLGLTAARAPLTRQPGA